MSQAILISSQSQVIGNTNQLLIVTHNGNEFAWTRSTNGGRGEANAWNEANYNELSASVFDSNVIGEILSTPLTDNDISDIENNERPNVLIQKLTKQYGLRHKTVDTSKTVRDVLLEVATLISTDPSLLGKYRSDGRSDKNATEGKTIKPSISIVREPIARERVERATPTSNSEINGSYFIRVPSKEDVGHYIPRIIDGVTEENFWNNAIEEGWNVLIEGPAGTGKSTSPAYDSYLRNQGCAVISCSVGLEVSHLIGKTVIDPETGKPVWVDGILTQAMKNGDKTIFDEVDFAQPKVLQRIQDVAQSRTLTIIENGGEVVVAHPNFSLVATYNNGYRHSNKLNEAFLDRFTKLRFDYDPTLEKQIIKSKKLLELANQLRADSISGLYSTPISLRILKRFQIQAEKLGYEFASKAFVRNFTDEERASVQLLLDANRDSLEPELTK